MTALIPPSARSEKPIQAAPIIRRARIEDSDAVCAQVCSLAEASSTAARWSDAAYREYLALEAAASDIHAKALFIACVPTEPIGSLVISSENARAARERVVGFAAFSAITGAGECALDNMVVAESSRKQGIGMRLLSAGLLWCRAHSCCSVWLEVRASNQGAIALYERAGFSIAGRRPGYYSEPAESAIQMQKLINPVVLGGSNPPVENSPLHSG